MSKRVSLYDFDLSFLYANSILFVSNLIHRFSLRMQGITWAEMNKTSLDVFGPPLGCIGYG